MPIRAQLDIDELETVLQGDHSDPRSVASRLDRITQSLTHKYASGPVDKEEMRRALQLYRQALEVIAGFTQSKGDFYSRVYELVDGRFDTVAALPSSPLLPE